MVRALAAIAFCGAVAATAIGQDLFYEYDDAVSPEIEAVYTKGLTYLVRTQGDDGSWAAGQGAQPGVVGLAVLAMLAHGEDPNHGPYSDSIKKGLDFIIKQSNSSSGYIGSSMYNHGFAALALAEAYGAVDDPRIGKTLKRAIDLIVSAQSKNNAGGWRYGPTSPDADTTVSGAQMVALLAARNAGISVPKKVIRKGLLFYRQCQSGDGGFGYTGPGSSNAPRSAIGTLVFALAREKDSPELQSAIKYLKQLGSGQQERWFYYLYYAAQAYFHADMQAWEKWNAAIVKRLKTSQGKDGSWTGQNGAVFSTSASLLALALNYRFLPIYER